MHLFTTCTLDLTTRFCVIVVPLICYTMLFLYPSLLLKVFMIKKKSPELLIYEWGMIFIVYRFLMYRFPLSAQWAVSAFKL